MTVSRSLIHEMAHTEIPQINDEEREQITKSLLAESWIVTFKVLEDLVGTDATKENLEPYLRNAGFAFVSNMRKRFVLKDNDIHTIAVITALANLFFEIDAKEVEHTDEKITLVCTDCIYQNCSTTICWMGHAWGNFIVEAINPDYEERVTQMVTDGDSICTWVIEKKKKV
jgi:hypothetical protein